MLENTAAAAKSRYHARARRVSRDAPTLTAWRELKVPVLDYAHFGDTSDFRGIGSDQARFRRMGAMKVAAFHQLLKLNRIVLVSDVDTVWTADPQPFLSSLPSAVDTWNVLLVKALLGAGGRETQGDAEETQRRRTARKPDAV